MGQTGGKMHGHAHLSPSNSTHPSSTDEVSHEPLPVLTHPSGWSSSFLTNEDTIRLLATSLPSTEFRKNWKMLYSSPKHGKSFNRFCAHTTGHGPTLIFIRDSGGTTFGGFADSMWWDKYPKFYGTGTGFVFSFRDQRVYRATGQNDHYQWLNQGTKTLFNGVGMGGQEKLTVITDESFDTGTCRGEPNTTFGCPILSSTPDWEVGIVEVWEVKCLGDVLSHEQEKLLEKKNKTKSVLEDDDNADKVIRGMMGHEFSQEDQVPDVKKKDDAK